MQRVPSWKQTEVKDAGWEKSPQLSWVFRKVQGGGHSGVQQCGVWSRRFMLFCGPRVGGALDVCEKGQEDPSLKATVGAPVTVPPLS